jgi:hypothetical protein
MALEEEDFEVVNSATWVSMRATVRTKEISMSLQKRVDGGALHNLAKVALLGSRVLVETRPAATPAAFKMVYSLSKMSVSMVRPGYGRGGPDPLQEVMYPLPATGGGGGPNELVKLVYETHPLPLPGEDPEKHPDMRVQLRLQPTRFYFTPRGLGRILDFFDVTLDPTLDLQALYDDVAGVVVEQTKAGLQFAIEGHELQDIQVDLVAPVNSSAPPLAGPCCAARWSRSEA